MPSPVLLVVSQITDVRDGLVADLDRRFGDDYAVLASASSAQAHQTLAALAERRRPVAVVIADGDRRGLAATRRADPRIVGGRRRLPWRAAGAEARAMRRQVADGQGNGRLEVLTLLDRTTGDTEEVPAAPALARWGARAPRSAHRRAWQQAGGPGRGDPQPVVVTQLVRPPSEPIPLLMRRNSLGLA